MLTPYEITLDLSAACEDLAAAEAVFDRIEAMLPEGVLLEGGAVRELEPGEVLEDGPLMALLQR